MRPDYSGGGIVNLMASIAARFGHHTGHRTLRALEPHRIDSYKKIVLIVVDGLGWDYLERHGGRGFFAGNLAGWMTSVFPSTTASAVTTFATGAAPAEHGVTGWFTHLRELGSVSKILFSRPRHGGVAYPESGAPMDLVVKAPPLFGRLKARSFTVTPDEIISGEFAKAISAGAEVLGYNSLAGFISSIGGALESGESPIYVSAYWPELDGLCHHHGVESRQVREHFLELEASVERLCRRMSDQHTLFLITSDHGLANTPPSRLIDLDRHPLLSSCLSLPLCGEPRLAYCYVHPDREAFFRRYIKSRLGRSCRLYTRRQLVEGGYFGPAKPNSWFHHRVGDYILAMGRGWSIRDALPGEEKACLLAGHGGMSPEEMLVPLIIYG